MTTQQHVHALLDQQAQQRDDQASSSKTNKVVIRRKVGRKQADGMHGRRRSA
ncbi:hypothetical protein [Streptomyces sp. NPDC006333]|uniref:hypothetical protein n=1 Tax=Streptomyces sp. NPDC006333 TaxID=3156753 RepID=UPI0033AD36C8